MPEVSFHLPDLERFDQSCPLSQLLYDSEQVRMVLFCLRAGQQVPAHTADSAVTMCLVRGKGSFLVGDQQYPAIPGTVAVCAPNQAHGMKAEQDMVVLATISPRPGGH